MTKEQVYDEQISSLMTEIIAVCQKNKIAMIASFHIPNDEDDDLLCTTVLPKQQYDAPDIFYDVKRLLNPSTLFITKKGSDGKTLSVTAVLP